eukprot:6178414-Pleurochrysis_carterae.AAC.3
MPVVQHARHIIDSYGRPHASSVVLYDSALQSKLPEYRRTGRSLKVHHSSLVLDESDATTAVHLAERVDQPKG